MIKSLQINEFQGKKQFALKSNFSFRQLKQHNLRKYIRDMDNMNFVNPNSNQNAVKKNGISNFLDLNNCEELNESGVWSEVICYVNSIKAVGKNTYMSCPFCKKKVIDEFSVNCLSCEKFYDIAKHRYILSVNLSDAYDSVWATAYDEVGEKILGFNDVDFPAN
jgi:hypothetical protein